MRKKHLRTGARAKQQRGRDHIPSKTVSSPSLIAHAGAPTLESGSDLPIYRIAEELRHGQFHCLANQGFGDGLNNYAHSMAWFKEHIYVGTSRGILAMVKVNKPPPGLTFWPINSPDDVYELDRRAHIWRYNLRTREWQRVFISPDVCGRGGKIVARDIGYRGMTVFQGPDDPEPALYVCTWSSSKGQPPLIMRSRDGVNFESLKCPPWGDTVNTFRTLEPFNNRLYTAPTGSTTGYGKAEECVSHSVVVWETSDPTSGDWRAASHSGFGDPTNATIFKMASFNGYLYAGTVNPVKGYQIWKTRAKGKLPYYWKKIVSDGAGRGNLNEICVTMQEYKGALYVGSGIINGGYDRHHKVGPAAAEMIRIWPDDSWELLIGNPRIIGNECRVPLAQLGPGFDNFFNGYIWAMTVHDGALWVGTFKWNALLPFIPLDKWPEPLRKAVEDRGIDVILENSGGCELWYTRDGIVWQNATRTGFGSPFNWGIRNMVSTPGGLAVGTANPFGPEVAIKNDGSFEYHANPRGGVEIWMNPAAAAEDTDGTAPAIPKTG